MRPILRYAYCRTPLLVAIGTVLTAIAVFLEVLPPSPFLAVGVVLAWAGFNLTTKQNLKPLERFWGVKRHAVFWVAVNALLFVLFSQMAHVHNTTIWQAVLLVTVMLATASVYIKKWLHREAFTETEPFT